MRPITRVGAAACVVGALALGTSTAGASNKPIPTPQPTSAGQWGGATCATGSLDGFEVDYEELIVFGSMTRCDTDDTRATFGVAFFRSDLSVGTVYRTGVRNFSPIGQPHSFGVLGPATRTWEVCLMANPSVRLDCGVLTPSPAAPGGWTYQSIPADDPLVDKPVSSSISTRLGPGRSTDPKDPNCGACWG